MVKGKRGPGKKRRKKDPNAPKRGMSAFMIYANQVRNDVKDDNPGISFGELGKKLGELWRGLSDEEKRPFQDQALQEKGRYDQQKAAYESMKPMYADDDEEDDRGRRKKKKKDPNAPKRGMSAFMIYANEVRNEVKNDNPGITFGELGKMLGELWRGLSEDEKRPYQLRAASDKARYENEKAAYETMKQMQADQLAQEEEEEEEEDDDDDDSE